MAPSDSDRRSIVEPTVRFDDRAGGVTRILDGCVGAVRAERVEDVRGSLEWAAAQAREGRWVAGLVSYDAAPAFDPALRVGGRGAGPLAWFGAFTSADGEPWADIEPHHTSLWAPIVDAEAYRAGFEQVRAAIRRGDTYQTNLTFPVQASISGDPRALYLGILASQDVAHAAYLDLGDIQIASVSPEQFFAVEGARITTRPMKGTRPRGRWRAEDLRRRSDLAGSEKDRAENLMIVDLIRNDLGRIAMTGSVHTSTLFTIEAYRTVWQMTSEITAELRPGVELVEVFGALFPCGSVTGAPKASTMDIIADVEAAPRGVYCGAVGLIPPGNGLDGASFNVAIRTAVVDSDEGIATYGVGGGVTWDSNVEDEYAEALSKAAALRPGSRIDGLFETVRWDGDWVLLDEHLDRLSWAAAAHELEFDRYDAARLLEEVIDDVDGPLRIRLTIDRRGDMHVESEPAPDRFATAPGPVADVRTVAIDLDPVDPADPRLYVKTTDRRIYEARRRRHRGVDDVILTNTHGDITESTIANVAVLLHGTWVTPPVSDGLLPGVLRARLISEGRLTERSVSVAEATSSDGLALINSVRGWQAARLATAAAPRVGSR